MWRGLTKKVMSPLFYSIFFFIFLSCNLFTLREPEEAGNGAQVLPVTFSELLKSYKTSFVAVNINQYETLLSDSFSFRVCDRIYYSDPDFYSMWGKDREIKVMQNLFLALSQNEAYPVVFDKFDVISIDTTLADSQYAKIEYLAYFYFASGEVDTAHGYVEIYGRRKDEFWQVALIRDYEKDKSPCLSDVKIKFLTSK